MYIDQKSLEISEAQTERSTKILLAGILTVSIVPWLGYFIGTKIKKHFNKDQSK
jgi:hypothetical protein